MIPRYAPTYTFLDLVTSFYQQKQPDLERKLTARLSDIYQAKHVFLLGSGKEALYALFAAHNRIGEILMPAYNCLIVPEAAFYAGYSPKFIDNDLDTLNVTHSDLLKAISPNTSIALLLHLFGIPCELEPFVEILRQHDILIVEDAAPAQGAEYHGRLVGTYGDAAIISFQSTKVLAAETGGAILTNKDDLAVRLSEIIQQASPPVNSWRIFAKALARRIITYTHIYGLAHPIYRVLFGEKMYEVAPGERTPPPRFVKRCSPFSVALALRQMDRLTWNISQRRKFAQQYQNELSGHSHLTLPQIPQDCAPSWIQFPILAKDKFSFYKHMQRNHVDVTWTYRYSCPESFGQDGFPNAHRIANTIVSLPTCPLMSDRQVQEISLIAKKFDG
jgi:dTDP-4-amino-4,6-dideoxygalactose transaminase